MMVQILPHLRPADNQRNNWFLTRHAPGYLHSVPKPFIILTSRCTWGSRVELLDARLAWPSGGTPPVFREEAHVRPIQRGNAEDPERFPGSSGHENRSGASPGPKGNNQQMTHPTWQHNIDECTLSYQDETLRLRALDARQLGHAPLPTDSDELAPFALQEWVPYRLVTGPTLAEHLAVRINHQPIPKDRDGPFWSFAFQNQIGKCTIRVAADGIPLPPLTVEVLSNKFPTPAEHLAFYRSLLEDLVEQNARLPFAFEAVTGHAAEEAPQPPTLLFVYHFLRQYHSRLGAALETILHVPHRLLHEQETILPLAQTDTIDPGVVDWILANPQEWVRAPQVAIARRLRGHAPARVWQRRAEETFDTPPNRFVRHFVGELAQWLAHPELAVFAKQLLPARAIVEEARRAPLFDQVGDMHRFPGESQILLRRDGYRELSHLWRLFHLARRPFFGPLQEAIDSRDVATLYEFWCFYALAERLQRKLGSARFELEITDTRGLEYEASARFAVSSWRLVYNQPFWRRDDCSGSYSVGLRPDFSLVEGRRAVLVFDAKFRFEAQDLSPEVDTYEQALTRGDLRRVAKRADLYKMHTYRDALGARAAVALYPGDEAIFYDASTHKPGPIGLDHLLGPGEPSGVGALPFSPGAWSASPV